VRKGNYVDDYQTVLKQHINDLLSGKISGDEFWSNLDEIRTNIIHREREVIKSYALAEQDYRTNHPNLYNKYKAEHRKEERFNRFVSKIHSEAQFYESNDQARSDLNATPSEGMHYLDDEELRQLIKKFYEEAIQTGLWLDEEIASSSQ
jgi:hypothetical protein